jgi:capsular polysaccharide biosynthesis protein
LSSSFVVYQANDEKVARRAVVVKMSNERRVEPRTTLLVDSAAMATAQPPERTPELDAEREVDFGEVARKLLSRWWLIAASVAVGALIGYLTSLGGGDVYQSRITLYLGQPLSPTGNVQIQSLATNPATVNEIVRSDSVVQDVAREIDVRPNALRRGIATKPLSTADAARRTQNVNPLIQISVRGRWRGKTAEAARLLAAAVIEQVSGYVDEKVRALEDQLAAQNRELASIEQRLDELGSSAAARNLPTAERLTLVSLIGLAEQRRGQLVEERTDTESLLTLAETVERSQPINEARESRVPAQSSRSSILVGALLGLLAGLALALLWDRLRSLRRPRG